MSNEITTPDSDPMKALQLAAMNINGLSQQMGLVVARMDAQDQRIAKVEEDFITIKAEQTITRAQCRRIRKAVMNRVNGVLKIEFEGGRVADSSIVTDKLYRGGFISRLYTDAKNHSKMGESYTETLKVDFNEVMDYINAWEPEVDGGTEGYKRYLDIRREERAKREEA
jgi:hypothetical protein